MTPILVCLMLLGVSTCGGQSLGNLLNSLLSGGPPSSSSQASAVRSATNLLCSLVESSTKINPCTTTPRPGQQTEQNCRFPFTFRGETYDACADWTFGGQPAGTRWCSTKVDWRGVHVKGSAALCSTPGPTSCPPPPGESPPPGCSLTFIQDQGGEIDCQEDEDCPYR